MYGIFLLSAKCLFCCLELVERYFKVKSTGRVLDMLILLESIGNRAFQRLGGRGYDDFVPGEVTETTPSGDRTT